MKKVISYCLFQMPNTERWLFYTYFRGLVWNIRMNKLIYPEWENHIEVDAKTFSEFNNIFFVLRDVYGCTLTINQPMPLCKGMLTRLKPIFEPDVEYVMCRDADAITTYREAVITQKWLNEIKSSVFTIRDNPAHGLEIMGGLSSYRADVVRNIYGTWDNFLSKSGDLSHHGSDQAFLMDTIYKTIGATVFDAKQIPLQTQDKLEDVPPSLWTSSLCCFFIGSAGVNEMETIRWMRDNAKNDAFEQVERSYPQVFYWHQL